MRQILKTALIVGVLAAVWTLSAQAANPNPGVLPINSTPCGKAYGEWSGLWWQWALSIPADKNPMLDQTGEYAAIGQSGPVWFLAGTQGGTAERTVTVPAGNALFFPIVNFVWVNAPEFGDPPWSPEQEANARAVAAAFIDGATGLACEIDGRPVANIEDYRCQTPPGKDYMVAFPEANVWGIPEGTYGPSVDDGIYLMLAPLSVGKHTIHFAVPGFLEVTYHLTVKSLRNPNPGVLPVNAHAFGTSYSELALQWWQWLLDIPAEINPAVDETGEHAAEGQSGKVWFLAGNFGGESVRTCQVPAGKAIFFPIISYGGWSPTDGATEEEVRASANSAMDLVSELECTIDGVALQDLYSYRVESPVGSFGPNNMTDVPDGSDILVADGYWLLLAPLSKGDHVIHFRGGVDAWGFVVDVTYNLTVGR